jgi:hypothetical protein
MASDFNSDFLAIDLQALILAAAETFERSFPPHPQQQQYHHDVPVDTHARLKSFTHS